MQPIINSNRVYSDLNLNFIPNPLTGDVSAITGTDAVINSVKNLVETNHYERPFHPEIGSGVENLLFYNSLAASYIQKAISDTINNFEPRATLQSVVVNVTPDANSFIATITVLIKNVSDPVIIKSYLKLLR